MTSSSAIELLSRISITHYKGHHGSRIRKFIELVRRGEHIRLVKGKSLTFGLIKCDNFGHALAADSTSDQNSPRSLKGSGRHEVNELVTAESAEAANLTVPRCLQTIYK